MPSHVHLSSRIKSRKKNTPLRNCFGLFGALIPDWLRRSSETSLGNASSFDVKLQLRDIGQWSEKLNGISCILKLSKLSNPLVFERHMSFWDFRLPLENVKCPSMSSSHIVKLFICKNCKLYKFSLTFSHEN